MEEYIADLAGLKDRLDEHPYDLSYSERKILTIATVIAMDSEYIILDEPTTGQDYMGIDRIGRIIQGLKEQGKTIITITHDVNFAVDFFQRTVVLCRGLKLLDGDTEEVLAKTEELKKSRIRPPYLTLLAQELGFHRPIYTIQAFYESIVQDLQSSRYKTF
jgi:energy-coupling factor transport system ATP-binding protein